MGRTIIYAPNVGAGGGLVLLCALLKCWHNDAELVAFLDERARAQLPLPGKAKIFWCQPSFRSRFNAEVNLKRIATNGDVVFCFHNLPPVFKLKSRVRCYVHNPNLVGIVPKSHLSGWVRVRYAIERFIAGRYATNIDQYIVQTPSMARALLLWHRANVKNASDPAIKVMPFIDYNALPKPHEQTLDLVKFKWDFLYVSDGSTHKNHLRLFEAWVMLANEGFRPSLALTLRSDRDHNLIDRLEVLTLKHNLMITDLGQMPHQELLQNYSRAKALLFASYAESYGIPLLEAKAAGLPIVAAERDFVRDMCAPVETFDPFSPVSIARAVKRFLYNTDEIVTPLTPDDFIDQLLKEDWESGASVAKVFENGETPGIVNRDATRLQIHATSCDPETNNAN